MIKLTMALAAASLFAAGVGAEVLNRTAADDCELVIVKQGSQLMEVVRCDDGSSFELSQEQQPSVDAREQ